MIRPWSRLLVFGAALGLAACAQGRSAPPPSAQRVVPAPASYGVILAARPLPPGGAAGARGVILARLGAADPQGRAAVPPQEEFIVRTQDGRTISIVQGNPLRLRPGERVLIAGGAPTRLARPETAAILPGG